MGLLEEVKDMRAKGKSDSEIIQQKQAKGIPSSEIYDALSQANIKEVVSQDQEGMVGMESSLMSQDQPDNAPEQENQQATPASADYQTQTYDSYPQGISADTIAEIADQVLQEKLASIMPALDKILDFKSSAEAKLEMLDERLKRIEKIIDRLQLSILQKVGESMTNIEDIKHELLETQKSFKSLMPEAKSKKKSEE